MDTATSQLRSLFCLCSPAINAGKVMQVCVSIVQSGGYADDVDDGLSILYTGAALKLAELPSVRCTACQHACACQHLLESTETKQAPDRFWKNGTVEFLLQDNVAPCSGLGMVLICI